MDVGRPLLTEVGTIEPFKLIIASGTRDLRCTLPFERSEVNDAIPDTHHHFALLNIDLNLHRAVCQFCQLARVFRGETGDLKILKTVGAAFDFVPPDLSRPAAVRIDNYFVGLLQD